MSKFNNSKSSWKRFALASLITIGGLSAKSAFAAEVSWTGGTDDNWSNQLNWSTGSVPLFTDDVKFTGIDSSNDVTPNPGFNVVNSNLAINSLWYSNLTDPFGFPPNGTHTTQINNGVTLAINGGRTLSPDNSDGPMSLWVGAGPNIDAGGDGVTSVAISGAGTLSLG
jgi:hypothetical protein